MDPNSQLSVDESELKWFRENWFKMDLIDPAKWALFEGDVVLVTNKFHRKFNRFDIVFNIFSADYLRFGRVSRTYIPHGYIWVQGLNVSEPIHGMSPDGTKSYNSLLRPFNYR